MGELAARVLQEEPPAESEESGQEIAEQDEREQPDRPAVAGNEEVPVRDQEATLVEQVEPSRAMKTTVVAKRALASIGRYRTAWSSRKYVIVSPSGLTGTIEFGTCSFTTNTRCAT